ncbi:pilus assembly protein PilE [Hahella sp. CCB-MM4]|uniref:type IV pilin protein n=1 Tax=Hahella sp. (strain CCB-MM4) TaxID=1926491 RepID=UPI000B9C3B2D|nr:type IV pilin protein [Hahella sp. CCB-MM4]OZG71478.1 pilus assembly protein PilE [Hahella sp. CCB-MM4]
MKSVNNSRGFSLIELMIVMAIVGILAAIAYPSYQESTAKSRRADGQSALVGLAAAMERYYTENNFTYVGAADGGAGNPPIADLYPSEAPLDGSVKYYDLEITTETASTFSLTATPKNAMAGDRCGDLTLNSAGTRGADEDDCWR